MPIVLISNKNQTTSQKLMKNGYFELNYLSKGKYSIIAFEDETKTLSMMLVKKKLVS